MNFPSLTKLLESLINQFFRLILVADSLTDAEFDELQEAVKIYPDLRLLRCDFGSAALTRNFGLAVVESEWIVFWDCDDMVNPDAYVTLFQSPQIDKFDIVVSQIQIESLSSSELVFSSKTKSLEQLGIRPAFTRIVYRTRFINGLVFVPVPLCEDQCFLASVLSRSPRIMYSELVTYRYKIDNPFQGSNTLFSHDSHLRASRFILNLSKQTTNDEEITRTLLQMSLRLLLSSFKRIRLKHVNILPRLIIDIFRITLKNPSLWMLNLRKITIGIEA